MGKIFGYMALCRSGILSQSHTTEEDILLMISNLVKVSKTKSYLIEASYSLILDIAAVYLENSVLKNVAAQTIVDLILKDKIISYHELWVVVVLQRNFPELKLNDILAGWKSPSTVLGSLNMPNLKVILKESSFTNKRLHNVWVSIIENVIVGNSDTISVQEFWSLLVEGI